MQTISNKEFIKIIILALKIDLVETRFAERKVLRYISNMCAREFSDSNFDKQASANIDFSRNCPKFHIFTKIVNF